MYSTPPRDVLLYAQSEWDLADAEHFANLVRPARMPEYARDLSGILTWLTRVDHPHQSRYAILSRFARPCTGAWVVLSHSHSLVRPMMEPGHADILPPGFRYEVHRRVTATDVHLWAGLTGEQAPIRSLMAFAQQTAAERCVAPGAYLTGLVVDIAGRLAAHVPSPGALLTGVMVQFIAPVPVGATLTVVVTVTEWDAVAGLYRLDIRATLADGTSVVTGIAGLRPRTALLAAA